MATKLNWEYQSDSNEYHAIYNGYRIRAVLDNHPSNPFEEEDGNWPICVRSPDTRDDFVRYPENNGIENPLWAFNDAQLIHNQVHIAKALGFDYVGPMLAALDGNEHIHTRWTTEAGLLRDAIDEALKQDTVSTMLETAVKLYEIAGVPAYLGQPRGYSQGDWAEVLVVAPAEIWRDKFGNAEPPKPDDLEATVDLYGAWAWGDVYGYIVERIVEPVHTLQDDPDDWEETSYEETDSCWGFYGSEFDKSGLEEAALECIPDPAAGQVLVLEAA